MRMQSPERQLRPTPARKVLAAALSLLPLALAGAADALPVAPGYEVSAIPQTEDASGSVLAVGGSVFYGDGAFGAGSQSLVRLDPDGSRTVLATGFNSIAGIAWDAAGGRLVVGDNGGELVGAATGDTLFAVDDPFADPAVAPTAAGLELAAPGSLPGVSDVVLDPADPGRAFASDSVDGVLWEVDLDTGTATVVQSGLGFAAGLAVEDDTLFLGDVDASLFTGLISTLSLAAIGDAPTPLVTGLDGLFDLLSTGDGRLLATAGSQILEIDPGSGATTALATGLGFATGLAEEAGTLHVVDGDFFSSSDRLFRLTPVPEPSTALLLGLGLLPLASRRR